MPPLSACKVLASPYLTEVSWHATIPLGSILIWRPGHDANLSAASDALTSTPWCTLVVEIGQGIAMPDRNQIFDAVMSIACLPVFVESGDDPLAAVRNRRPPTTHEIARYVMRRPGYEELGAELAHLSETDTTRLPSRTLRDHFSRQSHFSPRHWRWVMELAQMKALPNESAEALAGRHHLDVRTLRHRVRTCLDVSLSQFRELVGWEWRVEAALRLDARKRAESGGGRLHGS